MKKVQIRAADVSAAILIAAKTPWPPQTIALRILNCEGREVFGRQENLEDVEAKMTPD